jgi:hypothetical protein
MTASDERSREEPTRPARIPPGGFKELGPINWAIAKLGARGIRAHGVALDRGNDTTASAVARPSGTWSPTPRREDDIRRPPNWKGPRITKGKRVRRVVGATPRAGGSWHVRRRSNVATQRPHIRASPAGVRAPTGAVSERRSG